MNPAALTLGVVKLITALLKRRRQRLDLGLTRKQMRAHRRAIRHGQQPAPQPQEAQPMSWLSKTFDSTKNSGLSKKVVVLFITGTLLPTLSALGVNDNILTMLGQLAALYLGGQSVVDAAYSFKAERKVAEVLPEAVPLPK